MQTDNPQSHSYNACMIPALIVAATTYVTPAMVHWKKDPTGAYVSATLYGKDADSCGEIRRARFKDGYVYPWHVNSAAGRLDDAGPVNGTALWSRDRRNDV